MIALCTRCGAFIFEISPEEADARINIMEDDKPGEKTVYSKGGLFYTKDGKQREDYTGWLVNSPELISILKKLGCLACYIEKTSSPLKTIKVTDFNFLDETYRKVFKHKTASLKLQKGKGNEKNV